MITANVTGATEAGLLFDQFPLKARDAFVAKITDLTRQLESRIAGAAPVKTGALQAMVRSFIDSDENRISGKVKVVTGSSKNDAIRAIALEYGAHGRFTVAAHQRQISTVFGRAVAPTAAFVGAYERTANISERRFMRGPLEDMSSEILEQLRTVLADALGAEA